MANWKYTVNLQPEWQQAQDGELDISQLVPIIVARFRAALPADLLEEVEPLLGDLETLVSDANEAAEDVDGDDFDEEFGYIYNWCDDNLVWVKTVV